MKLTRMFMAAALFIAAGALPAMAVHFTSISLEADCDGYMVTYSGQTFPWESVDITFTISLTDMGGNVIDDVEMINVPVDNSVDPSAFGGVYYGTWDAELCGLYTVDGVARVELYNNPEPGNSLTWGEAVLDGGELDCSCDQENPGTGTPGFWMNHACAWPVDMIIFDRMYPKDEAIMLMKRATRRDKTYSMFQALVAAKLNVALGNEFGCVEDALEEAELWMIAHPVGSGVRARSVEWQAVAGIHDMLDDYNNGRLCAPHRDDVDGEQPCKDERGNRNRWASGKVGKGKIKNFPNPFNPVTTIEFSLMEEGDVTLEIYNMLGEKVATLANGFYNVGTYGIQWDASKYASGTYFTRLTIGGEAIISKLLLVK